MNLNDYCATLFIVLCYISSTYGALRRCYVCRSRGDLGTCKDPFGFNSTQAEAEQGIDLIPCASGWCGKILETENALKEEYGVATQRLCLQRGPSDGEDRCAYTKWQYRNVLMCFCRGDLCNGSPKPSTPTILSVSAVVIYLLRTFG